MTILKRPQPAGLEDDGDDGEGGSSSSSRSSVVVKERSEAIIDYDNLIDPATTNDPSLPTPIPRRCFDALSRKGRWYHGGSKGPGSKNHAYTAEVLSQLYYKGVVDRMRVGYEKRNGVSFRWVVVVRPDTVLVNDLPDLTRLDHEGFVYVPSWGHGYDPRSRDPVKRRPGLNDRFGFGGAKAMKTYHDMYARMCHDEWAVDEGDRGSGGGGGGGSGGSGGDSEKAGNGEEGDVKEDALPGGLNYEQILHWYLNHRRVRALTGEAGELEAGKITSTRHIPGEFWFLRLRKGRGTTPVEHPGHRPAMVTKSGVVGGGDGVVVGGGGGGGSGGRRGRVKIGLGRKRWEVWAAATRDAWTCRGGSKHRDDDEVDDKAGGGAPPTPPPSSSSSSDAAVECWLRRAGRAYRATGWVRWIFPRAMIPEPGGWFDHTLRFSCGIR